MMDEEKKKMITDVPTRPDYDDELIKIIKGNLSDEEIRDRLESYHENDISAVLDRLTKTERLRLYKILGVEKVSEIFSYLEEDVVKYIEELAPEKAADIIESMDADDAVDVLDERGLHRKPNDDEFHSYKKRLHYKTGYEISCRTSG